MNDAMKVALGLFVNAQMHPQTEPAIKTLADYSRDGIRVQIKAKITWEVR